VAADESAGAGSKVAHVALVLALTALLGATTQFLLHWVLFTETLMRWMLHG
jgi:hypothetical protein